MSYKVIGGNNVFVWPKNVYSAPVISPPVDPPVAAAVANRVTSNVRHINWGAEVRKAWGDEYYEREDVYEFTNDRKMKGR